MNEEWQWSLGELFSKIEDGLSRDFTIYGRTFSFMDIFIWGTLGTILIGFLREIISRD